MGSEAPPRAFTLAQSIFATTEEGLFEPTRHARGPWDPNALHGGAPAALIGRALQRTGPGEQLPVAQMRVEFLRPIPFAPLSLTTDILRRGRRVQELGAWLHAGEELICRAQALRIQPIPAGLPGAGPEPAPPLAGPEQGQSVEFALNGQIVDSFAVTAMEMRWLDTPWALGPGRVWMRMRRPLVPGEQPSPLVRLLATADFPNGVSAELPFDRYLFINADLSVHLWREPVGEWIGLDARTYLPAGGMGTSESVIHDQHGPVGRGFQALVVQPR
ncbi:MAG TPA: thioesterase family protein [Solirubrobacteraceae bacterium]|nr:thioesterase family protein [Solirubrobacteraceae bacterium]